jgi:2-(3-amino-3-carboxypropyl)histidine synthase
MANYKLQEEEVIKKIKDIEAHIVGLQFPDGLKVYAVEMARIIEKETEAITLISGDACYGACDLSDVNMQGLVDLLVHFGHTPLPLDYKVPVMFVEAYSQIDVIKSVQMAINHLKPYEKIGLVTTTQHLCFLESVADLLRENGKEVLLSEGKGTLEGQILGCNFTAASRLPADAFLYLGSGNFHPIGLQIATDKRVVVADPYMNEARLVDDVTDRMLRIRFAKIIKSKEAKKFGVLVSTKAGQQRLDMARNIKQLIQNHGREAYIILLDNIKPESLMAFRDLDAYIVTACPRIAIDDAQMYEKPLLTFHELEIALGIREWEDYDIDQIIY